MEFTSIFVGVIPMAVTNVQFRVMLGAKAKIKRRYHKKAKIGYASILIPNEDVDRVLKLDLSVAGHKLRVAKWRSFNWAWFTVRRRSLPPIVGMAIRL